MYTHNMAYPPTACVQANADGAPLSRRSAKSSFGHAAMGSSSKGAARSRPELNG